MVQNKGNDNKEQKKRCKFGQVRIAGKCRGLPKPGIRGSGVEDTGVSQSGDLEGIGTRNSLSKVD